MTPYVTMALAGLYLLAVIAAPPRPRLVLIALGVLATAGLILVTQKGLSPCGG